MEGLDKGFQSKILDWIEELRKRDLCIEIKQGYISPFEQAKLWKSGHSDSDIDETIQNLQSRGHNCIAEMIMDATSTIGPLTTNLLPGCSWHNWRLALTYDLKKIEDNRVLSIHNPEYKIATRWAKKVELYTGDILSPNTLKPNIIQTHKETYPTDCFTLSEIDSKLREWYDNLSE